MADIEKDADVNADDFGSSFTVELNAGEARLLTWFGDAHGNDVGAYYVYVDRL